MALEPKPRLALCWPTVEAASLRELVAAARASGYRGITLTPMMYVAAREAGASDPELRRELESAGIDDVVLDPLVRPLPGLPAVTELPPAAVPFFGFGQDDFHRIAGAVGARTINVAHILGRPVEHERMVDAIGRIAGAADREGLRVVVEFSSHSAGLPTFARAWTWFVRSVLRTWRCSSTCGTSTARAATRPSWCRTPLLRWGTCRFPTRRRT